VTPSFQKFVYQVGKFTYSSIQAIQNPTSCSKLVQYTWQVISKLDTHYKWSLGMVRGHSGNKRNEEAHLLAKAGTTFGAMCPAPFIPIPNQYIKNKIANLTLQNIGKIGLTVDKPNFGSPHQTSKNPRPF
jgi:hypothetical protein